MGPIKWSGWGESTLLAANDHLVLGRQNDSEGPQSDNLISIGTFPGETQRHPWPLCDGPARPKPPQEPPIIFKIFDYIISRSRVELQNPAPVYKNSDDAGTTKRTGNLHRWVRGVMYNFDTTFTSHESRLHEFIRTALAFHRRVRGGWGIKIDTSPPFISRECEFVFLSENRYKLQ